MLIFALAMIGFASEVENSYEVGEEVVLWFTRGVIPASPSDSYSFHDIPICRGKRNYRHTSSASSVISGIEPLDSGMKIQYTENLQTQSLCSKTLSPQDYSTLINAIQLGLLGEFNIDGLPIWVDLGKALPDIYLFTTYHITIHYNQNHIIKITVQPDDAELIFDTETNSPKIQKIHMKYSVSWMPTDEVFQSRMDVYYGTEVFSSTIHWYSLVNTSAIILMACIVVMSVLWRTLKKDIKNYEEAEIFEVTKGWKQMNGEVNRQPVFNLLFTGLVCVGGEIAAVGVIGLVGCAVGLSEIIEIVVAMVGYLGGGIARKVYNGQKGFIGAAMFAGCFVPIALLMIVLLYRLSGIVILPHLEIAVVCNIFLFLAPVVASTSTCKSIKIGPPMVSKKSWLNEVGILIGVGGLLPFISIALELHYFLASFLTFQYYYVYTFALVSTVHVIICLSCVGILTSYLILNSEDHRWQWSTFLAGGSLGIYVFIYSIYFYLYRNGVKGLSLFIGHMCFVSSSIFLASGAVSYLTAAFFLQKLYNRVKFE